MPTALTAEELAAKEHLLNARERALADKEKGLGAKARFTVTIAAQVAGLILLFVLGGGTFPIDNPDIVRGLYFIQKIMWCYLGVTLIVPTAVLLYALLCVKCDPFDHPYIDKILLTYVGLDLLLLLLLVCQEGGLCRSMFLPVFFLIPIAYLAAEQLKHRVRKLFVLTSIVVCIVISYFVSRWTMPPQGATNLEPAIPFTFGNRTIHVTDFSTLAHSSYDEAILYASLVAAFVPIVQIGLVMCIDFSKETQAIKALLFHAGDFTDLTSLKDRLGTGGDQVSAYLKPLLSAETLKLIDRYDGSERASEVLEQSLMSEFNRLLKKKSFYEDRKHFEQMKLREETKLLLAQKPRGEKRVRLNRLLLEDTYPQEIASHQNRISIVPAA